MSTCISQHGEYSSHELNADYVCTQCGVLDEDALIEELGRLRDHDRIRAQVAATKDAIVELIKEQVRLIGQRDEAQAQLERQAPVIEAARALVTAWRMADIADSTALRAAVDALGPDLEERA